MVHWAGYCCGCTTRWHRRGSEAAEDGAYEGMGYTGHQDGGGAEEGKADSVHLEKLADEYTVVGLDKHTGIQVHMRSLQREHGRANQGVKCLDNKFSCDDFTARTQKTRQLARQCH